jgi:urease accessory protein
VTKQDGTAARLLGGATHTVLVTLAGLLLLADSRLPAGGHVHSGGVEALVERRLLRDEHDLAVFLRARVRTAGLVAGAFAAAAAQLRHGWRRWDAALDARTPSAALREVSRAQGSALLRTALPAWPAHEPLRALAAECAGRPHQPLVLGVSAAATGASAAGQATAGQATAGQATADQASADQAAALAVHHLVGGAATAAVRLLGLDPLRVAAVQAGLAPLADATAASAAGHAQRALAADDPDELPADATPLPEILAELHHATEVTLFAS